MDMVESSTENKHRPYFLPPWASTGLFLCSSSQDNSPHPTATIPHRSCQFPSLSHFVAALLFSYFLTSDQPLTVCHHPLGELFLGHFLTTLCLSWPLFLKFLATSSSFPWPLNIGVLQASISGPMNVSCIAQGPYLFWSSVAMFSTRRPVPDTEWNRCSLNTCCMIMGFPPQTFITFSVNFGVKNKLLCIMYVFSLCPFS